VSLNYFELFGLKPIYNIELDALESSYRKIQSDSHPDRFVTASPAEKLISMQQATLANEAYLSLKKPAKRAQYLLELQGITSISETNTAMSTEFLMQQMEWREATEDATSSKDITALENLLSEIRHEAKKLQEDLINLLDEKNDYIAATVATRKLIFIDKVSEDINRAIEQLDI
jgi:molecular chaperone HscB